MTIVEIVDDVPRASTLVIAEGMNVGHKAVMQLVTKYYDDFSDLGLLTFKMSKVSMGRPTRYSYLNEEQTIFICTLMRNNETVVKFKKEISKDFMKMRRALIEIKERQENPDWKQIRQIGKITRKESTDIIQDFIKYAKSQGSKNADNYFMNFTSMENKALFIITQKFKNVRDVLDGQQLMVLGTCDQIVLKAIKVGMEEGMFYKDIFQEAKKEVIKFVDIIGKSYVPNQKQIEMG